MFWLWPLPPMCSQNWAGSYHMYIYRSIYIYMPVQISHIWFGSEGPDHIEQNQPGSDLDSLARFWPNASGLEVIWCARIIGPSSGRMHPAHYKFPTFRLDLDHVVPRSDLVLDERITFWPNRSSSEASQCARCTGPTSEPIWVGCDLDVACLLG